MGNIAGDWERRFDIPHLRADRRVSHGHEDIVMKLERGDVGIVGKVTAASVTYA